MNGPSIIRARPIATIFGRNANVASLIWVMAWANDTRSPMTRATPSIGKLSFMVTTMQSWISAATSSALTA